VINVVLTIITLYRIFGICFQQHGSMMLKIPELAGLAGSSGLWARDSQAQCTGNAMCS
jgi:hypothetical protein